MSNNTATRYDGSFDDFMVSIGTDGAMLFRRYKRCEDRLLISCSCDAKDRAKWRINGNLASLISIRRLLGVEMDFIDAVEIAVRYYYRFILDERIAVREQVRNDMEEMNKKVLEAELRIERFKSIAYKAHDDAHRRLRELNVAMIVAIAPAEHSLDSNNMPQVPPPCFMADDVESVVPSKVSGVYFAWEQPQRVAYVGKSRCIRQRILSHNVVMPYHAISYVPFPEDFITPAEHYYIWKLRPRLNDGGKNAVPTTPSQS